MIALFQIRADEPERLVTLIHGGDFEPLVDLLNEIGRTIHGPDAKVIATFPESSLREGVEAVELADFCDETDMGLVRSRSMDPVVGKYLAWLKEGRR